MSFMHNPYPKHTPPPPAKHTHTLQSGKIRGFFFYQNGIGAKLPPIVKRN